MAVFDIWGLLKSISHKYLVKSLSIRISDISLTQVMLRNEHLVKITTILWRHLYILFIYVSFYCALHFLKVFSQSESNETFANAISFTFQASCAVPADR